MKYAIARLGNLWRKHRGASISVGHCHTPKGSSVLLCIGRKRAGLTPEGARKIADQLKCWADHAENHSDAIKAMKWIVRVTMDEKSAEAEKATRLVSDWIPAGDGETASLSLSSKERE